MKYTKQELDTIWDLSYLNKIQQKKEEWLYVLNILNNYNYTDNIIDIGAYDGGTTISLKHFAKNMVTIDINNPSRFDLTLFDDINYKYIGDNSHNQNTFEQVKSFIDNATILWLDGDHSYAGIKQDFEIYTSLLIKDKSLVLFHDIASSSFHESQGCYVSNFWDELKKQYKTEELIVDDVVWGGIGVLYY